MLQITRRVTRALFDRRSETDLNQSLLETAEEQLLNRLDDLSEACAASALAATVLPFPLKPGRSHYAELEVRYEVLLTQLQRAELRADVAEAHLRRARRELVRWEEGAKHRQRRLSYSGYRSSLIFLALVMFALGYVVASISWS